MPTIAILDDAPELLSIFKFAAGMALPGWHIETFSSPEAFKEFFGKQQTFDLVMTDFHMPPSSKTGADVAQLIREHTRGFDIKPMIILCSTQTEQNQNPLLFDDYIKKPATLSQLSEKLASAGAKIQSAQRLHHPKNLETLTK